MSEDLKCVKLKQESVQTIIAALLLASSEEDYTAKKYEESARAAAASGNTRMAKLMQEAAENCRQRAGRYRAVYHELPSEA